MLHHEWVSINTPPHSEAFLLFSVRSSRGGTVKVTVPGKNAEETVELETPAE